MSKDIRRALMVAKNLLPERPVEAHPVLASRSQRIADETAPADDEYRGLSDSRLKVWANRPDPITRADHILDGNTVTTPEDEVLKFPTREHAINYIDSMVGHWPRYADGGNVSKWFGNSRVVGEDGKPLVAYKAMRGTVPRMNPETGLTHVALDPDVAREFSKGGKRPVHQVHVMAENPFDFRNPEHMKWLAGEIKKNPDILKQYNAHNMTGPDDFEADTRFLLGALEDGAYQAYETPVITNLIRNKGHDGIYMTEEGERYRRPNLGLFRPHQIKSATDNNGNFDSEDPDITKARGGSVHPATQIPGVHISERTHGKPIFTGERIGKADGGLLTGQDQDGEEGITAYQGGPHSVGPEGYSNDKIGTGEGAQVYGYGHYFAEAEPVAREYRYNLSSGTATSKTGASWTKAQQHSMAQDMAEVLPEHVRQNIEVLYPLEFGVNQIRNGLSIDEAASSMRDNYPQFRPEHLDAAESALRHHEPKFDLGHMHQVRIQGRPEHFLDYDKPLGEQSDHVKAILGIGRDPDELKGRIAAVVQGAQGRKPTPEEVAHVNFLLNVKRWAGDPSSSPASNIVPRDEKQMLGMAAAGIRGIRYLDQGSRNNYLVKDAPDGTANMTDRNGKVISNHPTRQEAHAAGKDMGSRNYVVFDPKHIDIQRRYARGGMAYADGGSLPDAGVQKALDLTRDLNPQGLYSHASEAAMASPQAKGPLPQMLASLKGVKPDELKYSGVDRAFAGKPRVTREELAQHFQKNLPDIQETVLRPSPWSSKNYLDHIENTMRADQEGQSEPAKYAGYTLPGGENYREILLHSPEIEERKKHISEMNPFELKNFISREDRNADFDGLNHEELKEVARSIMEGQGEGLVDDRYSVAEAHYNGHWPKQSVFAHLRLKDRTGPNGEKILHAEEIQSDWGQQARGNGTYDSTRPYQVFETNTGKVLSEHATPEESAAEVLRHRAAGHEGVDHGHAIDTQTDKEPVPDAPYIGNTQGWTDLALKRLLHEAAAGGYDKIVWTPGAEQAKRYDKANSAGMEGYYDKIIPKSLLALAKQHDPDAQLEATRLPVEDRTNTPEEIARELGISVAELSNMSPQKKQKILASVRGTIGVQGLTVTSRMREGINKRGFKAYARGGDVEGTMRIAKAGGGPLGDDEAVKKALALTAQTQPSAPQQAVQTARRLSTPAPAVNPASPLMEQAFQAENRPGIVVSPRPGKGSGPPITREMPKNVPDIYSKFPVYSDHPDLQYENEPWNPSTPNLIGAPRPSPVQEPVRETPRMKNVTRSVQKIFKTKGFNDLIEDITKTPTSPGIRNLEVTPIQGTWKKELEPSFILHHPDMTDAHAAAIAPVLGFGKLQDAAIRTEHNPSIEDGTPAALIGHSNGISEAKLRKIAQLSGQEGLDFSQTKDGTAVKYLHFGKEHEYPEFLDKVNRIADAAGLPERGTARASTELINAKDYLPRIFGENSSGEGLPAAAKRSPDLFRRIVDHVLAPYAKAIAGEGYRLSPERLQEAYGLTDEETDHVRTALYPGKKGDRTTVPLMTGEEDLDVRPTGGRGQANVNDVMYALQNRAARQGQIDPGDYSDTAKENISKDIASEVAHHVNNSDKSAIGWYDKALKAAMDAYSAHFPQLKTDPDKKMLFHALLGITSQGQNVHENSAHAVRLFDLMENQGMTLPQAVDRLEGTFGDKTRAIEHNLLKFDHLVKNNGYDKMRDVFNQKMSVAEWRKKLKEDPTLFDLNGKPFSVSGKSNQQVTGWSVFGPKIGSFINNLHGDYSTLTADLWFSRTWGRLLGHNFMHTPAQEADQYRDFRDALKAERMHSPAAESLQSRKLRMDPSFKTSDGKLRVDPATGKPKGWLYGDDAKKLSEDEYQNALGDPEAMLELAKGLHKEFKDSGYKDKSDLRRRAKNWIENRENSVAAPRSDNERGFQQDTVEQAQKLLKNKYGLDISVADIQAALWFHEKELFGKYGVASEKAQPADYADAARGTLDLIQSGNLYNVQSKEPKAPKKAPLPKKADGGTVDAALRLVSQYGQPLPDAVNLARQHTRGRP